MASVSTIVSLNEYKALFDTMQIDESKGSDIRTACNIIKRNKNRYAALAFKVNPVLPWYAIGIVHYLECNCNFFKHIHNGDPLTGRTVQVPAGRPLAAPKYGNKYTWEESCEDWLILKNWHKWKDWGIADILYRLEANNGMGYKKKGLATPYLWSFTDKYDKGKYVQDGKFDAEAVSKQVGAAILLKELINLAE